MIQDEKQIIFLLDDEEDICLVCKEFIKAYLPEIDIYTFTSYDEFKIHELLPNVSLFIYDIMLNNEITGDKIALEINKINKSPVLFISGLNYNFDSFRDIEFTYDFITKPIDSSSMINRIKLLLKFSTYYKSFIFEKNKLYISIKELMDYSNIYMVVINKDLKIKMCSLKLAKDLGYNNINEIEGKSWLDYIDKNDKTEVINIHKYIISDNKNGYDKYKEINSNIILKDDSKINVKWFNAKLNNNFNCTFSIGIPYDNDEITENDSMDDIRTYWRHIINENNSILNTLRILVKK